MEELEKKKKNSSIKGEEEEEEEMDNSFVPVYHSFSVKNYHSHVVSGADYLSILASKDGDYLLSPTGAQVYVSFSVNSNIESSFFKIIYADLLVELILFNFSISRIV